MTIPYFSQDLIDTLWNVKLVKSAGAALSDAGFNRYIVECKEVFKAAFHDYEWGFNRYIVECKVQLLACDYRYR